MKPSNSVAENEFAQPEQKSRHSSNVLLSTTPAIHPERQPTPLPQAAPCAFPADHKNNLREVLRMDTVRTAAATFGTVAIAAESSPPPAAPPCVMTRLAARHIGTVPACRGFEWMYTASMSFNCALSFASLSGYRDICLRKRRPADLPRELAAALRVLDVA